MSPFQFFNQQNNPSEQDFKLPQSRLSKLFSDGASANKSSFFCQESY
jgi:hypothetical protein